MAQHTTQLVDFAAGREVGSLIGQPGLQPGLLSSCVEALRSIEVVCSSESLSMAEPLP